jgi:hypothetical protein
MDGARVTPRKDANGNVPRKQRDEQLVLPMRSLGEGIFIHPSQVLFFQWFQNVPLCPGSCIDGIGDFCYDC